MNNVDCSFVHPVPALTVAAEEASIRIALQRGRYRKAGSLLLREAAICNLIKNLHDAADNLSIQSYSLDYQMDCDGNLDVTVSFATDVEMVLVRIHVS